MKTSIWPLSMTTGIATFTSLIGSRRTFRRPGSSFRRSAALSKRRAICSNGLMWCVSSRWPRDACSDADRKGRLLVVSFAFGGSGIVDRTDVARWIVSPLDDAELVAKILAGDEDLFTELV